MFANNKRINILNRNHLKYIVIILMLFDHICFFLPSHNPIRIFVSNISCIVAPTMALFIAEGYHYTSDLKKYMGRLLLFAVISYIPYILFFSGTIVPIHLFPEHMVPTFFSPSGETRLPPQVYLPFLNSTLVVLNTSVIFTLFLGLLSIYLWDKVNMPIYLKLVITLLIFWLAAFTGWRYYLILLCLIFYFLRDNPKKMWSAFFIVAFLVMFNVMLFKNPFQFKFGMEFDIYTIGILLVPLFFALYDGKPGNKSAFNKWFFYIFYPLHLLILGLIRILI